MTKQDYGLTHKIMDGAFVSNRIDSCIGILINNSENSDYGSCISMFPRPENPIFHLFCQPKTLEEAKKRIFEGSDIEHKQIAFMDSILMDLTIAITDDPECKLPEGDFLKAPPPKVMQNYDRDDLWRRFQADYAKWLESIPEEYRLKE